MSGSNILISKSTRIFFLLFPGDGQEQKDEKVDDDEDRQNPQYIPKKGMFYEHDNKIDSSGKEAAKEGELESEKANL